MEDFMKDFNEIYKQYLNWLNNLKEGDEVAVCAYGHHYTFTTVSHATATQIRVAGDTNKYRRKNGVSVAEYSKHNLWEPTDELKNRIAQQQLRNHALSTLMKVSWHEYDTDTLGKVVNLITPKTV